MTKKISIALTLSELDVLRTILGFVEAGEISGGPLEGLKHQHARTAQANKSRMTHLAKLERELVAFERRASRFTFQGWTAPGPKADAEEARRLVKQVKED